jgi:hypothetical protein
MAAWLASFTRLASCSWRSASRRCDSASANAGLVDHEQPQQPQATGQHQQPAGQQRQRRLPRPPASARLAAAVQAAAQRLAVGHDGGLRLARRHQALQVAQDGAGLGARLLVLLEQLLQRSRTCGVLGAGQAQFGIAVEQAVGDLAEGVQVLAEQEHGLGTDAFHGQELVGALADALRQHHQLAHRRQLGRRGALLQLQRRHRLGRFQQVGRLAVDGAQRLADLGQRLLLPSTSAAFFSARSTSGSRPPPAPAGGPARRHVAFAVSGCARCAPARRRFPSPRRNAAGAAQQGLRHRLGQPLRLRLRLAGGATCDALRLAGHGQPGDQDQAQQARAEQPSSTRCWRASGQAPIIGRPLPSSSSPGRRVSL